MPGKATIIIDKKSSKSLILKNNSQMPRSSSKNKISWVTGLLWIKISKGKKGKSKVREEWWTAIVCSFQQKTKKSSPCMWCCWVP